MTSPRRDTILARQLNAATHSSNLLLVRTEQTDVWAYLLCGMPAPFEGEYIFALTAPEDYPLNPPRIQFWTPNGLFVPHTPICISIGEFHSRDTSADGAYGWRPAMGMQGFAQQIASLLVVPDTEFHGIGIQYAGERAARELAHTSRRTNMGHEQADLIEALIMSGDPAVEPFKTLQANRAK